MTDYLSIKDPAELHAAVERAMHENPFAAMVAEVTVDELADARQYAPHNQRLLDNEWVQLVVAETAHSEDVSQTVERGRACIVRVSEFAVEGFGDVAPRKRHEYPLRDDRGAVHDTGAGVCDRCGTLDFLAQQVAAPFVQRPVVVFHIARGRFVVEFVVCDNCFRELSLSYGPVVQVVPRGAV
jgi:hypothetical protein